MTYYEKLESAKTYYPFDKWREMFFPDPEDEDAEGLEQYTEENCNAAKVIFDNLINGLHQLGENASEPIKVELFKIAVLNLNELNEEADDCLIETGEREQLCELIDQITIASGLNPKDYAEGAGIADEWRDW
jgi:hypothetical protein